MDEDRLLYLTALDGETPERLARLLIDLSELIDGRYDHPRETGSFELLNRLLSGGGAEQERLMEDPLRLLPYYFSIVQYVLVEHVETPGELDQILAIMETHRPNGGGPNQYLQVIKETFARTIESSQAIYARMEALEADLARFEQHTGEQAEGLKEQMDQLTAELDHQQQGTMAKTEALLERLEELSSGRSSSPKETVKPQKEMVAVGRPTEALLIGAGVVLFIIILIALLSL